MNRSIDLLEALARESNNFFGLTRRGYVFLTGDPKQAEEFHHDALRISALGAGPIRVHQKATLENRYTPSPPMGYLNLPTGADLVLTPDLISQRFPFITNKAIAMLHPRRCGWLSAQQLGAYLMDRAKENGMRFINARVSAVSVKRGQVEGVTIQYEGQEANIDTQNFVICAGPYLKDAGKMLGVEFPVENELHGKIAIRDEHNIIPQESPLMLWDDPVNLSWSPEERAEIESSPDTQYLLDEFPGGVHFKPEGGLDSHIQLALWTYDTHTQDPIWPPTFDQYYAEIVLRGLVHFVPGFEIYLRKRKPITVDGGYYCKTVENRPLIGPLPVDGAYVYGALSGFGIMAGMAGGELLGAHVAKSALPDYAPYFSFNRYQDPKYQALMEELVRASGQL
jgi:glycine/D-amino acid oxidase-like deaminating enzyme